MEEKLFKAKKIAEKYNQEHVFDYYDETDTENREKLIDQILSIDFEELEKLYQKTKIKEEKMEENITPIPYIDKEKLLEDEKKRYEQIGIEQIKEGKLAAVTMAGGQRNKIRTPWAKGKLYSRYRKKQISF